MSDIFSKEKRSQIMSAVRCKDTKLEISFRKKIWREGLRYRKNVRKYYGCPDLVLSKHHIVVFIDSCFWHGCKIHKNIPKTRNRFWSLKIEKNIKRDKQVNQYYKKINWKIIRFWEHDLKHNEEACVKKIKNLVSST